MLHLHNYILIWIEKISQSQRLQLFEQPNKTLILLTFKQKNLQFK